MIHFYERDSRRDEPNFEETCGSFSVIQHILRKGLRELGYYSENPDDAKFVGIADSLALNFSYKDKIPFIIAFWDNINTLSFLHKQLYEYNKQIKIFSINQHTADLYQKVNINCKVIGPGIDGDFWYKTKESNKIFTFIHSGFSNFRSGLDQLLKSYDLAFRNNKDVQLIIKNTSDSKQLENSINEFIEMGNNIKYINRRMTFSELRDLYSESHVGCNILRHSGHGLPIAEMSLCGCLNLAGNFDPSNKIANHGILLNPLNKIAVKNILPALCHFGLTNTFGDLQYPEEPYIYYYDIQKYSELLKEIYLQWNSKYSKINDRNKVLEVWNYKKSSQNLINYLLND